MSICLLLVFCSYKLVQSIKPDSNTTVSESNKRITSAPEVNTLDCLAPIKNFEYQIGEVSRDPDWSEGEKKVLPPKDWQEFFAIPNASELILIRSLNQNETEFWIRTSNSGLIRYQINVNWSNPGTLLAGPEELNVVYFLDRENNVWAARKYTADGYLLSKYNEQTNQWEPILVDIPNQEKLSVSHIQVDDQDVIWLLVQDGVAYSFYSFDGKTMKINEHLANYIVYPPFVVSHKLIYLLGKNLENNPITQFILIQYSPDNEVIKTLKVPAQFYGYGNRYEYGNLPNTFFVDSERKVWIGARGWIDFSSNDNYQWHFVFPNPIFVQNQNAAGLWGWSEPHITSETSDGRLWYNSMRGAGWVDPRTGKWCVFTSYQSNILADEQGNLWLLANGWLYRHK